MTAIEKPFELGETVFIARHERDERLVTCPDCQGKKCITVIMGDDTSHSINCSLCAPNGYEGPTGFVTAWDYRTTVQELKVEKIESKISEDGVKYEYQSHHWILRHDNTFRDKAEAEARGDELIKEHAAKDAAQLERKQKDHRSWAWHVRYYRDLIRKGEKDLVRYRLQLDSANQKAKK